MYVFLSFFCYFLFLILHCFHIIRRGKRRWESTSRNGANTSAGEAGPRNTEESTGLDGATTTTPGERQRQRRGQLHRETGSYYRRGRDQRRRGAAIGKEEPPLVVGSPNEDGEPPPVRTGPQRWRGATAKRRDHQQWGELLMTAGSHPRHWQAPSAKWEPPAAAVPLYRATPAPSLAWKASWRDLLLFCVLFS